MTGADWAMTRGDDIALLKERVAVAERAVLDQARGSSNLALVKAAEELKWAERAVNAAEDRARKPRLKDEKAFMAGRILWQADTPFQFAWQCVRARDAEWISAIRALQDYYYIDEHRTFPAAVARADIEALLEAKP